MARTYHVASYRGKRKCQVDTCGLPRIEHTINNVPHPYDGGTIQCEFCHKAILPGMAYKWCAPRVHSGVSGRKRSRHEEHPNWKPSELTSSEVLSTIYAMQEDVDATLAGIVVDDDGEGLIDELEAIATNAAEEIRSAATLRQEASEAIEEGFQHPTEMSDQLASDAEELEAWADEVEGVTFEEYDTDDEGLDADDWGQQQMDAVRDFTSSSPI